MNYFHYIWSNFDLVLFWYIHFGVSQKSSQKRSELVSKFTTGNLSAKMEQILRYERLTP